jgi:hypothetical protein
MNIKKSQNNYAHNNSSLKAKIVSFINIPLKILELFLHSAGLKVYLVLMKDYNFVNDPCKDY